MSHKLFKLNMFKLNMGAYLKFSNNVKYINYYFFTCGDNKN